MDEQAPMSEDETSDSEVIFVDNSPPPTTDTRQKKTQSKVVTEEMRMDEQLRELGLFEEGMSMEQKQELMVVLAASRETAEHEETMRQKAIEWERRLFSDVDDGSSYDTTPNEDNDHWKSDSTKSTPVMYGQNSATMTDASRGAKNFGNKADETYSQKVKFTEKAFKMLDVDEISKASESQDQKPMNTSLISADQFYSHSSDMSFPLSGSSQRRQLENSQKGKHHLIRSAYRPLSPSSSKVAVAHPMIRDSGGEMFVREEDCLTISPIDFQRMKFKLDKSLATWKPCTSPVAPEMDCKRASPTYMMGSEYVPFFCPDNCDPKEYANVILDSFKKYHSILRKAQEKSKIHIQWGEPVRVGRHHSDSLDALMPRHQVKVRNSDRMPTTRSSNRSNVEVSYAEMESKECNDDSTMMNIEDYPEPISSDSNSIIRTSKSAFRPIKTISLSVEKDTRLVTDHELDDDEHNISDTLPRSKSCPSPVASNSDTNAAVGEYSGRTLLSQLNSNKPLEEPGGSGNSSALCQWSPFAPSNAVLLNSETSSFDTFCALTANKTTPSFESVVSEASESLSEKNETLETESLFDSQFHVRKDGQKTYSSRSHYRAEKSLTVVSRAAGTSSNSQGASSSSAESSLVKSSECISPAKKSKCQSISKHDDVPLSQIEEGGISRKRKCELRLTRLTPSEIKAACPSKRWKKQS